MVPELSVRDITASRRYYCDVLGFAIHYERPDEGFACVAMGAAVLMLDQLGVGRDWTTGELQVPFGRGVNFQITVDAVAPLLERLAAAGVALAVPLETRTYRTADGSVTQHQFCVTDPDGYLLRFCEFVP